MAAGGPQMLPTSDVRGVDAAVRHVPGRRYPVVVVACVSMSNERCSLLSHVEIRLFSCRIFLGPDLQNILRQPYDYLTIIPKLRSTYDGRLIYKTSHEGRKAFLRYRFTCKVVRSSETVLAK